MVFGRYFSHRARFKLGSVSARRAIILSVHVLIILSDILYWWTYGGNKLDVDRFPRPPYNG